MLLLLAYHFTVGDDSKSTKPPVKEDTSMTIDKESSTQTLTFVSTDSSTDKPLDKPADVNNDTEFRSANLSTNATTTLSDNNSTVV
ncbi:hypothetical protein PENTCL1PPCAC_21938, partial [Pristionchus entomophagus]